MKKAYMFIFRAGRENKKKDLSLILDLAFTN